MTFQGKLTTKLDKYSVGDTVIELSNSVDKEQLNDIVRTFLKQQDKLDDSKLNKLTFDFLVGGRFLQVSVEKHLAIYADEISADEILSEKLVEIEYVLSFEAPEPREAIPHEDWVSCVDANESHIISGSYDNSIRIFTIKDRKCLAVIENAHKKPVTRVKWIALPGSAKKSELFFVSSGHDELSFVRSFNTITNKSEIIFTFSGHNRSVNCSDSSDDLVATGSFDKTIRIWSTGLQNIADEENETSSGKKKQKTKSSEKSITDTIRRAMVTLTGHKESVTGVRWLGDSEEFKSLATCSMDRTICVWDVEVGECKRRVLSAKPLLGIDYSQEMNLIISASCDRHIRAWDARAPENATAKAAYTSHTAWVSSVAFGKNPNNFISGGYDNVVKLWDLRSPKASLYDLIGHHDKVLDVNWRNSDLVLSGSADSTLKVFATNQSN